MSIGSIMSPHAGSITQLVRKVFHLDINANESKLVAAFAYGSGVINQGDSISQPDNSQLDIILVVDNNKAWHDFNQKTNPDHYSSQFMKVNEKIEKGHKFLRNVSMYFSTFNPVPREIGVNNQFYKYGVIDSKKAIDDLSHWRYLYLAGRLHKPVLWLKRPDEKFYQSYKDNLRSAIIFALLNPKFGEKGGRFRVEEIYLEIASISYTGDWRTMVGEGQDKIKKLVSKERVKLFNDLYREVLMEDPLKSLLKFDQNEEFFEIKPLDTDEQVVLVKLLPSYLFDKIGRDHFVEGIKEKTCDLARINQLLIKSSSEIVYASSLDQTILALLTTEAHKIVKYVWAKLSKIIATKMS